MLARSLGPASRRRASAFTALQAAFSLVISFHLLLVGATKIASELANPNWPRFSFSLNSRLFAAGPSIGRESAREASSVPARATRLTSPELGADWATSGRAGERSKKEEEAEETLAVNLLWPLSRRVRATKLHGRRRRRRRSKVSAILGRPLLQLWPARTFIIRPLGWPPLS